MRIYCLLLLFVFCVFHGVVKHMQKEWGGLAKSIHNESQGHQLTTSAARCCSCFSFIQYLLFIITIMFCFCIQMDILYCFVPLLFAFISSNPALQRAMENVQKAINRHVALSITVPHAFIQTIHSELKTQVVQPSL